MAATMKDIARMTGLGLATISSYLNGGNVREANRIKIEAAIGALQFEVNETARGLKTNRTQTIGVVIPELTNLFCAQIISDMEDILRKHGYAAIVCDCRTDKQLEKEAVEFLLKKRVDGIINMPVDSSGAHLLPFAKRKKPIVLIDRKIDAIQCDSVLVDNQNAAAKAVEVLLEHGHRTIGMIAGPKDVYTAKERLRGYREALKKAGISVQDSLISHGDYTIKGAVGALEELKSRNPKMTAVFASNYEMTVGAMIYTNEHGIQVPKELSVIGFDNLEFAKALNPALTIVTQPTGEIAGHAAELMLLRIAENGRAEQSDSRVVRLQTNIWMGRSVQKQ